MISWEAALPERRANYRIRAPFNPWKGNRNEENHSRRLLRNADGHRHRCGTDLWGAGSGYYAEQSIHISTRHVKGQDSQRQDDETQDRRHVEGIEDEERHETGRYGEVSSFALSALKPRGIARFQSCFAASLNEGFAVSHETGRSYPINNRPRYRERQ